MHKYTQDRFLASWDTEVELKAKSQSSCSLHYSLFVMQSYVYTILMRKLICTYTYIRITSLPIFNMNLLSSHQQLASQSKELFYFVLGNFLLADFITVLLTVYEILFYFTIRGCKEEENHRRIKNVGNSDFVTQQHAKIMTCFLSISKDRGIYCPWLLHLNCQ